MEMKKLEERFEQMPKKPVWQKSYAGMHYLWSARPFVTKPARFSKVQGE